MMPAVQMCGFLYSGADLCGFSEDTTPDLALRWLEFGLFTPLMRNHADARAGSRNFTALPMFCPPSAICWICGMPSCPTSTVSS